MAAFKLNHQEEIDKVFFYYQMHIVIADTLKTIGDYIDVNPALKSIIRQEIKQRMSSLNRELGMYATQVNKHKQLIGVCNPFSDVLIEFLNKATKDRQSFEEVMSLMSAYNNGDVKITED